LKLKVHRAIKEKAKSSSSVEKSLEETKRSEKDPATKASQEQSCEIKAERMSTTNASEVIQLVRNDPKMDTPSTLTSHHYVADCVLMVRPANFTTNVETMSTNSFQSARAMKIIDAQLRSEVEFQAVVSSLQREGVKVIVENDKPFPKKPDAIFPNNWISTHVATCENDKKKIVVYPMQAKNRRLERRMSIVDRLAHENELVEVIDLSKLEEYNDFLEGTGAMVFHRPTSRAFVSVGPRATLDAIDEWERRMFPWTSIRFSAYDTILNKPIYHTNVMMSIGMYTAVICSESIRDMEERKKVLDSLISCGLKTIEVTINQMKRMTCNILQLKRHTNPKELIWIMSTTAHKAFTKEQLETLSRHGEIIIECDIQTIEECGGGSLRCMLAEIFTDPADF
ncbi:hypothetical protein SNEBB_001793, partial [Seison nebaliae]